MPFLRLDAGFVDAGVMIASALVDRLLHNAETVVITGKSYRMKDQIEPPL